MYRISRPQPELQARGKATHLHSTHIGGEGGLVTDSRRDTAQQGRHLRTSLSEAENVVDEEQHILALEVAEVLGDGQTCGAVPCDTCKQRGARQRVCIQLSRLEKGRTSST
jgi:hypothetical protein